jgi:alpha-L-arabinofuranosidase
MITKILIIAGAFLLPGLKGMTQCKVTVMNKPLASVSPLLFGEFFERAGADEPGPEAVIDPETRELPEDVYYLLQQMNIPLVRFFGGAHVEWGQPDWRDLIDIPGSGARQPGNLYGYDEYFRTAGRLGWQSIIPVHFRRAVWKEIPLDSAAMLAAGLVAYCNGIAGNPLPKGMPDWPMIRAKNGHSLPYRVKYFQLGNEWASWMKDIGAKTRLTKPEEQFAWLKTCIKTFVKEMKTVDSTIEIIADAVIWSNTDLQFIESLVSDEDTQEYIDYYTVHSYRPWTLDRFALEGIPCEVSRLSSLQKWYAALAVPELNATGESVFRDQGFDLLARYRRKACITEWNWNGFGTADTLLSSRYLKGLGAAGFLHALLRKSDQVCFATQSMLLGTSWELNAVRAYPGTGKPSMMFPTGQVTAFYNRYHGDYLLSCKKVNIPVYTQPVTLGNIEPADRVAMLDIVATGNGNKVFIHVINRDLEKPGKLEISIKGFPWRPAGAKHHLMQGNLVNSDTKPMARVQTMEYFFPARGRAFDLPPGSVSIIEIFP